MSCHGVEGSHPAAELHLQGWSHPLAGARTPHCIALRPLAPRPISTQSNFVRYKEWTRAACTNSNECQTTRREKSRGKELVAKSHSLHREREILTRSSEHRGQKRLFVGRGQMLRGHTHAQDAHCQGRSGVRGAGLGISLRPEPLGSTGRLFSEDRARCLQGREVKSQICLFVYCFAGPGFGSQILLRNRFCSLLGF